MSSTPGVPENEQDKRKENQQPWKKQQAPKKGGNWKFPVIYIIIFIILMSVLNHYMASRSSALILPGTPCGRLSRR